MLAAVLIAVTMLAATLTNRRKADRPVAPVLIETHYEMAPFGEISVYRPAGEPRATALMLSGDQGWNGGMARIARYFANNGVLVAGVSTPFLMKALERSADKCIDANYSLIALAGDVQHRMNVHAYTKPVIIGYSSGATIAYASLAQWPNGSYKGVFSLGFSSDTPGRKPWCHAPGFSARRTRLSGHSWQFAPNHRIDIPWIVIQGGADKVVDFEAARTFAAKVPGARFLAFPSLNHDFSDHDEWMSPMAAALAPMLNPPSGNASDGNLKDLPLTILPPEDKAGGPKDVMAVMYSGDGGWVGIDRDVATQLASKGIPVVGMDSLSYFWSARTPTGAAADLTRIINGYSGKWGRPHILLIGYSFGADALPAIVAALDPATRSQIQTLSLLGLGSTADFQFHLGSWLDIASDQAQPTIPTITRLRGMDIRCIRGEEETESACPQIPAGIARVVTVPGGHHFDRNAALLAQIILNERRKPK